MRDSVDMIWLIIAYAINGSVIDNLLTTICVNLHVRVKFDGWIKCVHFIGSSFIVHFLNRSKLSKTERKYCNECRNSKQKPKK